MNNRKLVQSLLFLLFGFLIDASTFARHLPRTEFRRVVVTRKIAAKRPSIRSKFIQKKRSTGRRYSKKTIKKSRRLASNSRVGIPPFVRRCYKKAPFYCNSQLVNMSPVTLSTGLLGSYWANAAFTGGVEAQIGVGGKSFGTGGEFILTGSYQRGEFEDGQMDEIISFGAGYRHELYMTRTTSFVMGAGAKMHYVVDFEHAVGGVFLNPAFKFKFSPTISVLTGAHFDGLFKPIITDTSHIALGVHIGMHLNL